MKSFLFTMAVAALLANAVQSKDTTTFRVDSYIPVRFTDFQWKIGGNASLNGRNDDNFRRTEWGNGWRDEWRESESNDQQMQFWSDMAYQYTTIPTIYRYSLNAQLRGNHSKLTDNSTRDGYGPYRTITRSSENKADNWRVDLNPGFAMTRYIAGDWYISPGIQGTFGYSHNSVDAKMSEQGFDSLTHPLYTYRSRDKTSGYGVDGGALAQFELGFGRMYSGDFAFAALSIVGELRSGGYLLREPTYGEMVGLCDTVLEYRQRHAMDSRYRRIAALTSILNYLRTRGVIESNDPMLPFIIADVWDFFPIKGRRFGHQAGLGCELDYSANYYRQRREHSDESTGSWTNSSDQSSSRGRATVFARLAYDRPLSVRWQFSANSRVWYLATNYAITGIWGMPGLDHDIWGHQSDAGLSYYYDARTTVSAGLLLSRNSSAYRGYASSPREDQTEFRSSVTYRISVPTTITARFGLLWTSTDSKDLIIDRRNQHAYQFGVSIDHWLY